MNVCIHDFVDVKRRIKQGSFTSRLIQDCFDKQNIDSIFLQDQALPQNERFKVIQGTCNRLPIHVIDYQGTCNRLLIHVIDYQWFESV